MQISQIFVTPEVERGRSVDAKLLCDVVHRKVREAAASAGFPHLMVGSVVVVDGSTVRSTSPWLSRSGTPYLWVMADEIDGVAERDLCASVRVYLAIQILFPDHQTSATLFLRTLTAGNAAAVEIHLATLGPVQHSELELSQRLLEFRSRSTDPKHSTRDSQNTFYSRLFHSVRNRLTRASDVTSLWDINLDRIVPFDSAEDRELREASEDLDEHLARWIGDWARLGNWREDHSLTLTNDYFGASECRAALRALYTRVSEAALDALKDNGFDISDYCDKDGRWQIHADKIDSIVIGESITMNGPDEKKNSIEPRIDSAPRPATQ